MMLESLKIPNEIKTFVEFVLKFNLRPILVGGAVRDFFLGHEIHDWDFEIHGENEKDYKRFKKEVISIGEVLDLAFGVCEITLLQKKLTWAPPRIEKYSEQDSYAHSDFETDFGFGVSFKEASMRRDFSINGMGIEFQSLTNRIVHDPWLGLIDLKSKTIRHINPEHFIKDPLRLVRGFRFAINLNFNIESETLKLFDRMSLERLSLAHLRKEFYKCHKPLRLLEELDPWIKELAFRPEHFPCDENSYEQSYQNADEVLKRLIQTETPIFSWNLFLGLRESQFQSYLKLQELFFMLYKKEFNISTNFEEALADPLLIKLVSLFKSDVIQLVSENWMLELLKKYKLESLGAYSILHVDYSGIDEKKRQSYKVWLWLTSKYLQ